MKQRTRPTDWDQHLMGEQQDLYKKVEELEGVVRIHGWLWEVLLVVLLFVALGWWVKNRPPFDPRKYKWRDPVAPQKK